MRKENRTYFFSVEGETEKWYLDWLQGKINADLNAKYTVKLDSKIEKDPLARVKGLSVIGKTEITHIFDREGEEKEREFKKTIDGMKAAQSAGKQITYKLGYSNLTFELWMILHKADCYGKLSHRNQYLALLNRAYNTEFERLEQYKQEINFRRILNKLTLSDVRAAIRRSKYIMKQNDEAGYTLQNHKGYKYYRENPSLSIWESIEKILKECGLVNEST